MLKKGLLGYSTKDVDILIKQMESEFNSDKEILKNRIRDLETDCELLKNANHEDRVRLRKARNYDRLFKKTIGKLLVKNRDEE